MDTETQPVRDRLTNLNAKAYYLLVALSFAYGRNSNPTWPLKLALTLTAFVAVLPVQDLADFFAKSNPKSWLEFIRWTKVFFLTCALGFTLRWVWSS